MSFIQMLLRGFALFSLIASYNAIAADSDDGELPDSSATIHSIMKHKDNPEAKADAHQ